MPDIVLIQKSPNWNRLSDLDRVFQISLLIGERSKFRETSKAFNRAFENFKQYFYKYAGIRKVVNGDISISTMLQYNFDGPYPQFIIPIVQDFPHPDNFEISLPDYTVCYNEDRKLYSKKIGAINISGIIFHSDEWIFTRGHLDHTILDLMKYQLQDPILAFPPDSGMVWTEEFFDMPQVASRDIFDYTLIDHEFEEEAIYKEHDFILYQLHRRLLDTQIFYGSINQDNAIMLSHYIQETFVIERGLVINTVVKILIFGTLILEELLKKNMQIN